MKFWSKIFVTLLAMFILVTPVFAQHWPNPGKGTGTVCTNCEGAAKGKLTYPFDEPLLRHVGRYVDSTTVGNVQNLGMRTVRAGEVRSYPGRNRVAIAIGEGVGLYKLDTLFSTKLPAGMVNVDKSVSISPYFDFDRYSDPLEKVLPTDAFFYAESKNSDWVVTLKDSQTQLADYDMDDRGYLYVATISFGWGVAKDAPHADKKHLDYVFQIADEELTVRPEAILSLKVGSKYYVIGSERNRANSVMDIRDVTTLTPGVIPRQVATRKGYSAGVMAWDKHDQTQRVAIVTADLQLHVYDYADFVASGTPVPVASYAPSSGRTFSDVTFDEEGRVWAVEKAPSAATGTQIWRLAPAGSGYTKSTYDEYGMGFAPTVVHAAGGYVAVGGQDSDGVSDLVLFKIEGGEPQRLDLDNFFRKYYHRGPTGYVALDFKSPSYTKIIADIQLIEQGNKVYLMYSAGGLGDVYELQAGDSIAVALASNNFGTSNPSSVNEPGPFYGDILKFKATTTSQSNFSIDWDFGNPESGSGANGASSALNQVVEHQFTGLQNAAAVGAAKPVKAEVSNDASISDTLNVVLKVPKARIRVAGLPGVMTQETRADFEVVAGDEFADASDGVVEGHFSGWTISNVETKILPTAKMDVGALGSHSLAFTAYYGKYDDSAAVLNNSTAFKSVINNITYNVKPFIATIRPPVNSPTKYTFNADARVTDLSAILSATQWTVTWSIDGVSGITSSSVEDIGEIPPFAVDKAPNLNGKTVRLQIAVDPLTVPAEAFATYTTTQKLVIPEIQINKTGCTNAGSPCTLTAVSADPEASTENWQLQWSVKRNNATVNVGDNTANPLTFTPEQGSHSVSVTETSYGVTETLSNFTVAAPACGSLPPASAVDIGWSCTTCLPNNEIDIEASVFPNTVQPCHQFVWDFGDSTAAGSGQGTKHTYSRTGSFKIKLTIKTATGTATTVVEETIRIGTTTEEPPPCGLPIGIDFVYSGSQGCSPSVACKTSEVVTFTAKRIGGAPLASCDLTAWTIDGVQYTAKSPKHTFTTTGNKTVTVTVTNTAGTSGPITKTLNIAQGSTGGGSCNSAPTADQIGITFAGDRSNCGAGLGICELNESIEFTAELFEYVQKSCDVFEWNFGDGSPLVVGRQTTHTYTGARNSARVKLRVYNTSNQTGVTHELDVPFTTINEEPPPVLNADAFPRNGAKGTPVTFTAVSNISATGWSWNFDDGTPVNNSQSGVVGTTTSITHTFTKTGTFNVRVTARRAGSPGNAQTNSAIGQITITDTPEYKYLVLASRIGTWRTDVQIYNPDPTVSPSKPLRMTAQLRDMTRTLEVFDSTHIYEDFIGTFTNSADQGAVIITARTQFAPQIWTRTYSQTESGTFGQFIPAIRIDQAGGGAAVGTGKYYMAGLRTNARYRTNLGLVNPTAQALPVTVAVYDDIRVRKGQFTRTVEPYQLLQFNITDAVQGLDPNRPFSIELSVPDGQWLIGYCSFIDGGSTDPVYIQAVRESVLNSPDYRNGIVPGVGHIGAWRSDVTVFNPNAFTVNVDLAYHDASGSKKGEALAVPIRGGEFLQYDDILKQGVFGNVADGLGMLRVTLPNADDTTISPMTFARTYNDNGSGKTYGQGIRGFAVAQANVKPGKPALIAGVRKNAKYRTNIGLSNVSNTEATVLVKVLDPSTGAEIRTSQFTLKALESTVAPDISLEGRENASIRVEVTGGNVWAFGSIIDKGTEDPEYVEAVPLQ
ncbi:MAG TPA: PKD domain-containing protein [Thermoanaerobaculia bacterium]|nr:PKD domain-containing protein [Thermoanaerobaculia bacterium]